MKQFNVFSQTLDYESLGIFIGRFQPPHKSHLQIIKHMAKKHNKCILIIVSGDKSSIDKKRNPYSLEERIDMFNKVIPNNVEILTSKNSFIPKILLDNNLINDDAKCVVIYCGPDRKNDYIRYEKYLKKYNKDIQVFMQIVDIDRENISSTILRQAILNNDIEKINELGIPNIEY